MRIGLIGYVVPDGTAMASAILGNDPVHTGLAPDARYINARVLNASSQFFGDSTVMNGIGYAVAHGANVINLSLNYNPPSNTSGSDGNITVSAGNIPAIRDPTTGEVVLQDSSGQPVPPSSQLVTSPGSAYNVVTVGRTGVPFGDPNAGPITSSTPLNYDQIMSNSGTGPINSPSGTANRDKPDLAAPGTYITLANNNFTTNTPPTVLLARGAHGAAGVRLGGPEMDGKTLSYTGSALAIIVAFITCGLVFMPWLWP